MDEPFGSSQTWLFYTWLFATFMPKCSFAPFCVLFRSFADLRLGSFADICALLRSFLCFYVRQRLERPRLGTAEPWEIEAND